MKKFENLGRSLSKKEQKNITGGDEGLPCSVSCDPGYYACCCGGDCQCHSETDPVDYGCSSGGKGSSSCSVE